MIENFETSNSVTLSGQVELILTDHNGYVKEKRNIKNLVVTTGKNFIASRMAGVASPVMSHMAVGSSSTAPITANTDLGTTLGARKALTSTTNTNNTVVYVATFAPGEGTGAIVEAGLFNALTSGSMLCRTTFLAVNKSDLDTLTINWTVTIN